MNKGDIVVGRYRLEEKLGMGGMGTVWSAEHIQTGRLFALKIMHATVASSDDSRERFLKEAKASARINHPNVIDVLDVGELPGGELFMAMELLEGLALSDALRLEPPLTLHELLVVMREACAALGAAHRVGIIHRDVKPANIFLHRDKATGYIKPKVLDFGVSKFSFLDESNTHTGSLLGSPRYMSPEQSRSATQADQRSDVWSIGVILFESLIGSYPHDGDSFSNLVVAIATTPARSAQDTAPSANRALTTLIDDCLRPRDQRIPSCEVLAARIDEILASRALVNVPCARGKNKKSVARPESFVVQAPADAARDRPHSASALQPYVDEPSTNPADTLDRGHDPRGGGGNGPSPFSDPAEVATRPIQMKRSQSGPSSILGPVPSRTMVAPPGGPLGDALRARAAVQPAAAPPTGPPKRPLPPAAMTLLSPPSRTPRPPPPSSGPAQEATLIHTRMPTARASSDSLPAVPAPLRTIPMNAGLVAPPLVPPSTQVSDASSFPAGFPTQVLSYPGGSGVPSPFGAATEPRDQLVESVSNFNVERYRPGATPYSAPPPQDVDTTASRNRNRTASLLIAFGGASVVALAFIVIFLMGRTQRAAPAAGVSAGPAPGMTAVVSEPSPEAAPGRTLPRPAEPSTSDSAAPTPSAAPSAQASASEAGVPAPSASASAAPSALAPAASGSAPPRKSPPGSGPNRPYPPPRKDCSKDPIGCLDPQLR